MNSRLTILSVLMLTTVAGLAWLGYRAVELQAEGLQGRRLGEFAAVAEQIRSDVMQKLDTFIETERNRPYTDYQYYYIPEKVAPISAPSGLATTQQQLPLLRSPLGSRFDNDLAYGYFQVQPDGSLITPYGLDDSLEHQIPGSNSTVQAYLDNVRRNLLARLNGFSVTEREKLNEVSDKTNLQKRLGEKVDQSKAEYLYYEQKSASAKKRPGKSFQIESLQNKQQSPQFLNRPRAIVESNIASNVQMPNTAGQSSQRSQSLSSPQVKSTPATQSQINERVVRAEYDSVSRRIASANNDVSLTTTFSIADEISSVSKEETKIRGQIDSRQFQSPLQPDLDTAQSATVEIKIDPFVPVVVNTQASAGGSFDGEVFMVRRVQIENLRYLQGFQLNEERLLNQVKKSAQRFIRQNMRFDVLPQESEDADYVATLDFGFGQMVLNLFEIDPYWIGNQVSQLKNWYFGITGVVFLAVALGMAGLWRNVQAQVKLSRKKDDFISAVSHELRTPLTSIRMYTEMLQKGWVKSEEKRDEYYQNMHQETERLTRLIDNVLDFSRLQRGQRKFYFQMGDINQCIENIVEKMTPYARQHGFTIVKDFKPLEKTTFDSDAVMQIVINLIDNAIKYARQADDKTIIVRTASNDRYILIEVEDHGPGVPHKQRKKIFDEFYRCEDESRRETVGVGLGLSLVNKFAQAHKGFVEILAAKPKGALFRVALSSQN